MEQKYGGCKRVKNAVAFEIVFDSFSCDKYGVTWANFWYATADVVHFLGQLFQEELHVVLGMCAVVGRWVELCWYK